MANFIPPGTITTPDADYEINTRPGREHLLTLKGTWGGATITMTTYNDADGSYSSVTSGSWTADAEPRFIAPSGNIRLSATSTSGTTDINVTLIPVAQGR